MKKFIFSVLFIVLIIKISPVFAAVVDTTNGPMPVYESLDEVNSKLPQTPTDDQLATTCYGFVRLPGPQCGKLKPIFNADGQNQRCATFSKDAVSVPLSVCGIPTGKESRFTNICSGGYAYDSFNRCSQEIEIPGFAGKCILGKWVDQCKCKGTCIATSKTVDQSVPEPTYPVNRLPIQEECAYFAAGDITDCIAGAYKKCALDQGFNDSSTLTQDQFNTGQSCVSAYIEKKKSAQLASQSTSVNFYLHLSATCGSNNTPLPKAHFQIYKGNESETTQNFYETDQNGKVSNVFNALAGYDYNLVALSETNDNLPVPQKTVIPATTINTDVNFSTHFPTCPAGQSSAQTDSNVIAAKDISDLYQIINGGCHTTGNSCVTTVKNDCFGANGIDTTKFDAKTGDTTFLTNKFQNSAQAITAAGLCIQYYNFGKFKTAANSGLVLHIYKDDNKNCYTELVPSSDNIFDSSLICGAGVYSFYLVQKSTDKTLKAFKVNYQLSTSGGASGNNPKVLNCTGDCSKCPSDQVEATVQFGSEQPYGACTPLSSCPSGQQQCQQGGNAGSSGSSGSSGANGGSGSTTVTSCTGRCSVCQSGYVEGTITMADNSTHGECVLRSSCPAGQQDCKDNQDATQNAPSCNFSQSCGNGGTQVCPGKYLDGQCRYVAGSTCDPCKGEVGTPNRICSPGAYDVSCTGSCGPCGRGSGRGEAKVQQCNSSGTGWDGRNNECNGKCATYCGSAVPTGGCSYPESIDRSICGSGVHVCDGKYDNGVCKYDPGTSTNCRCA